LRLSEGASRWGIRKERGLYPRIGPQKAVGLPGGRRGPGYSAYSRLLTLPTESFFLCSFSIKQIVVKGTELS
jgi:hypothetical protein